MAQVQGQAKAGELQSTVDAEGNRHSEMQVIYRTDQPELARVSRALDAVAPTERQPRAGVRQRPGRANRKDLIVCLEHLKIRKVLIRQ